MKPTRLLDRATTPDGTPLTLHEHDGARSIRVGGVELMSTRQHHSEERLAELARDGIQPYNRPVTREELVQETPGMIPLLLARAVFCCRFHNMPIHPRLMGPNWPRFVDHYACKLPSI